MKIMQNVTDFVPWRHILIPSLGLITSFDIIYFVAGEIRAYSAPSFISAMDQKGTRVLYV